MILMNITGYIDLPLLESPTHPEIVNPLLPLDFPATKKSQKIREIAIKIIKNSSLSIFLKQNHDFLVFDDFESNFSDYLEK